MNATLKGSGALIAAGILTCADKALAMARTVEAAPEIDGTAGMAALALVAGVAALLLQRHRN